MLQRYRAPIPTVQCLAGLVRCGAVRCKIGGQGRPAYADSARIGARVRTAALNQCLKNVEK